MSENKKMEIVYIGTGVGKEIIEGFPVGSVRILGQNLDGAGFIELVNHFKDIFDECEYTIYAKPDEFNQNHLFPQPGQYSEDNPYGMLKEYDVRLELVNPALLVDPNERTLTYPKVTRIQAHLKGGLSESRYSPRHDDWIWLQFVLETEALPQAFQYETELWQEVLNEKLDKMPKPHYLYAYTHEPWSIDQLLKVLHTNYGISPELIGVNHKRDEKALDVVIKRLSTYTSNTKITDKQSSPNYQI